MKLNMWILQKLIFSEYFKVLSIITIWVIVCLFLFTPFSKIVTEKVLEQSIVLADSNFPYTLTPINETTTATYGTDGRAFVYQDSSVAITSQSSTKEGRAVVMQKFLLEKNSPLAPHAELIISEADKYGLDWRILVSISGVESRFCKVYPAGTFNGWGWKGGPGGAWQQFDNWEHSIRHLTARLALGYNRPTNPFLIESVYCPPCGATGQHYWARAVAMYMEDLSQMLENYRVPQ